MLQRRLVTTRGLESLIAGGVALVALILTTGGFTVDMWAATIRVRDWIRPLIATLALAAIYLALLVRTARGRGESMREPLTQALARLVLGTVTALGLAYWAAYFDPYCGGSDSYGYVSASRAILDRALVQPQDVATWLPVVNPLDVATPAGWVPSGDRSGIVPLYPLGLPALMAVATLAVGPIGPFLVPAACGIICLLLAHLIARESYGRAASWLAPALVVWSPVFVNYAKQPMSDVPATMWILVATWALVRSRPAPFLAGLAAGASFLTRPGGLGACLAIGLFACWSTWDGQAGRARLAKREGQVGRVALASAGRFAAGVAPFLLLQAWLQWRLLGDPFQSGYGSLNVLYAGHSILDNVRIFGVAIWRTQTPLWLPAVLAAWLAPNRRLLALAASVFVLGALPYLLYASFDHWETLRFLMPGLVLLTIVAAGGAVTAVERLVRSPLAAAMVVVTIGVGFAWTSQRFLDREGSPNIKREESRYPVVADYLQRTTPSDAVVFAAQHSGSIRYYANRLTLRWDLLRPEDLRPALVALRARERGTYVALEGTEQERFRRDFSEPLRTISLAPLGETSHVQMWELTLEPD